MIRIAIPSKGEMETPTLEFLSSSGLKVSRPNPRQYLASMPTIKGATVLFQRATDIPAKVSEGSFDIGITGLDNVAEDKREDDDLIVILPNLGYSGCELVIAVPDTWVDVTAIGDLADLATEFKDRGREMRIATKYPRLVQDFLLRKGVSHFTLAESKGAMEAAPSIGYADVIADITSSGTTLRENHLKMIDGGTILRSQACLIGNRRSLRECPERLAATRVMLEFIEARMRATDFFRITANVKGSSPQDVADKILARPELAGLAGPTVAQVYGKGESVGVWWAVALVVRTELLMAAVEHLRLVGGSGVTVLPASYVFEDHSTSYERLVADLGLS